MTAYGFVQTQTVEKPPFFMQPQDERQVIHINYFSAVVSL